MKIQNILIVLVAAAILLSACTPQNAAAPTAAPATAPAAASSAEAAVPATGQPAQCSAVSILPTPGPAETSLFPAPTEKDWKLGPDNALVTFMEYSDFQ